MKRIYKGEYGYLKFQLKIEIVKTLAMLILSLACYFIGLKTTGTNQNLLTFVAIFGCLPMAKFMVNVVMFIKAKGCTEDFKLSVDNTGVKPVYFDLYMTDYKKNYQLSALTYKKGVILACTEDDKTIPLDAEAHIKTVLANINVSDVNVKVYKDKNKFLDRLNEIGLYNEAENNEAEIIENLLSVSL